MDKLRSYLEGQPVVVRTDHKALVGSLTKKGDTALPIPRRHLLKTAQFVNKLHYRESERNGVADALSRTRLQLKNSAVNSIDNRADVSTSPSSSFLSFHQESCPLNCALPMPGTAYGDVVSRCQVLGRAGSVHHGADQ